MDWLGTALDWAGSALSGGLLGGLTRLGAEWLKQRGRKQELDQEYRLMELQAKMAADGSEQRIREAEVAGSLEVEGKSWDAYIEALRSEGRTTGNKLLDGLSAFVRPFTTYYWLAMYGVYKGMVLAILWDGGAQALATAWTSDDAAILSMILGFWFVGRTYERKPSR